MDLETARNLIEWLQRHPDGAIHWDCANERAHFAHSMPKKPNRPQQAVPRPKVILSGSFNPVHQGHLEMQRLASRRLGEYAHFELPIVNADKPEIDADQVQKRVRQFDQNASIWLTRLPTFELKARLFAPVWFVVGADTIERIGDPRFYDNRVDRRDEVVAEWRQRGVRFLVFGRNSTGVFRALSDLKLPSELCGLCQEVTREEFEMDLSSREIRRNSQW